MEIEGKIIQDLGMQQGTSKAGREWKKKEWVLETFGQFPRKVKFHIFGDKADTMQIEVGNSYTLSVDLESREFNGRWYTDVSCYAARPYSPAQPGYPQPGGYPQPAGYPQPGGYPQPTSYPEPAAYPPQGGYPQQPEAPQPFGGGAFPGAPASGGYPEGDANDDLPF